MKAALLTALNTPLEVRDDITLGDLGPGDVHVKIVSSGVCHSDVSAQNGTIPCGFPTVLGHGVAAPHAYSSALSERLCAIVRVPAGLDVETLDGEPVRLVFLLLSPAGDPEGHLATLADIARLVMEAPTRTRLLSVSSADEVVRIVLNASAP